MKSIRILLLAACVFSAASYAAPMQWNIVPAESQLSFTGTQNGAPVTGQFKKFDGDIIFDVKNLKDSHLTIKVDMNSISASFAELKETLITPDWFNVKLFPIATFTASNFEKTGDNKFVAHGNLTIRDKTLPVHLQFTLSNPSTDKSVVTGTTTVKRSAFGVGQGEWASLDEIKDDVRIQFTINAVKK